MGKIDICTKEYVKRRKVFADLFNYYLYAGRRVIQPECLTELDSNE